MKGAADPVDPLDAPENEAFDAFVAALARGETPSVEAWVARYGDASGELKRRLEALSWMTSPHRAKSDAPPFERLGDFRLIRKLGEGGMGVVWLAQQESLKRPVALKLIRAERLGSADVEKRFAREAEAVARLNHSHVVQVYAAGEERGVRWLAMEFVDGKTFAETLNDAVSDGARVEVPRVLRWIADVASALAAAHASGIVHRDVKPANIVIRSDGHAMLADFGLARDVDAQSATLTAGFMGTPSYAAPEQIDARVGPIGPQTDVYSLGATLYEGVTGVTPFSGTTTEQVLHGIVSADLVLPRKRNSALARDLEIVILKAMERDPARRYANAADFAADLEALLALRPIAARPPGFARRAQRYLARRPLATAAGALVLVLVIVAPLALSLQRRSAAAAAVAVAEARIVAHAEARERRTKADEDLAPLHEVFLKHYLPAMHKREMRQLEAERDAFIAQREAAFFGAIGALEQAERLGADADHVRRVRADLYIDAWRDALARRDESRATEYAALARQYDEEARHAAELDGFGTLTVRSNGPVCASWLFRFEELSRLESAGEPRLVPVPVGDASPVVRPGATVLRVTHGGEGIEVGDLITHVLARPVVGVIFAGGDAGEVQEHDVLVRIDGERIADKYDVAVFADTERTLGGRPRQSVTYTFERGGRGYDVTSTFERGPPVPLIDARGVCERGLVPALVVHDGDSSERVLPAGLQVRFTAVPLVCSDANALGPTPITRMGLPPGSYLVLVRAYECEEQRIPFVVPRGGAVALDVTPLPLGTTPRGFVFVPPGRVALGGDTRSKSSDARAEHHVDGFFIQEREVTYLEYFRFLEDPATQAEIAASQTLIRLPRRAENVHDGGYLPRSPDGRVLLPELWADWPVMGVSHDDAMAYVKWRNAQPHEPGLVYALPTAAQWEKAARGADERLYPFGNRMDPAWAKMLMSRPIRTDTPYDVQPERVLSFATDESPYGVFDLTGSMGEWMQDVFTETQIEISAEYRGGSWIDNLEESGRATVRAGISPQTGVSSVGIRLVATRVDR